MKLFFVKAEAHNGDADGPSNMDLFAHADAPDTAVQLWKAYYAGWDDPDDNKVLVYDVSQTALCPGAMDWDKIPCEQFTGVKL